MGKVNLDIRIDKTINMDIEIYDVIDAINQLESKYRWNYVAMFINDIDTTAFDLKDEHKTIVLNWLNSKIELFNPSLEKSTDQCNIEKK